MKSVILDAFDQHNGIVGTAVTLLEEKGHLAYFKLGDMNIQPCRGCGACGFKSPGRCVIKDDVHDIMKAIAQCDMMVKLTPIRFGSYSARLKSMVDRLSPLGLPLYLVKKGKLLHPMRYNKKKLLAIGLLEGELKGEGENFKALVEANAWNMQTSSHSALVFKASDDEPFIRSSLSNVLQEVSCYE